MDFKRLNTPKKIMDRILHYAVKQRFLSIFPRPSILYAKEYFKNKSIIFCEIGVFKGENSNSALKHLNIRNIYLIDPYAKYPDYESGGYYNKVIKAEKTAKQKLKDYRNKTHFIKEYSERAINEVPNCDFIYIDGNHIYPYVKKDLELYSKKLNKGGIIAGHDTQIPDVIKAVAEFAAKHKNFELNVESPDWWMVKKEKEPDRRKFK